MLIRPALIEPHLEGYHGLEQAVSHTASHPRMNSSAS